MEKISMMMSFCLLSLVDGDQLLSKTVQYLPITRAPSLAEEIGDRIRASSVTECLGICSRNDLCKSIVFSDGTCALYSTTLGSRELLPTQKALGEVSRQEKRGSLEAFPAPPPTCTSSEPMSSADSCTNALSDDINGFMSKPMVGSWLNINYGRGVLCTVIDVLASGAQVTMCKTLNILINQSTNMTFQADCVDTGNFAVARRFQLAEKTLVKDLYITCTSRCPQYTTDTFYIYNVHFLE